MYDTKSQTAIATTSVSEAERSYRIPAEQLTEGDVVLHLGNRILVTTEPQYTYQGIVFDALWLDIDSRDNTQQLCFQPTLQHNTTVVDICENGTEVRLPLL